MSIFNYLIKASLYLLVFLLPLFWLPFTFEAFEFNKQYLLFFLVSLAFFAWLAKMVLVDKEIRFRKTPLDIPVLAFLLAAVLSAIFSVDKFSSLFGFYGRFSDGLIGLLSLGMLYFLITNNATVKTEENSKSQAPNSKQIPNSKFQILDSKILRVFLWSVSFVVLFSYFSIFGIWAKLANFHGFPQLMLQRTFNPVSGSLEGLAVFLSAVIVLLVGLLLAKSEMLKWLLLAGSLGLLVIVDFSSAWIILLVTLTLFLAVSLWKRIFKEKVNRLLLPIFLIIVAVTGLSIDLTKTALPDLPREQVLDQKTSWQTAFGSLTDNVKSGFLGSGIGTFHYDFAKQKPVEFNQNRLWQIRFDRAGSHLAEISGTLGGLGLLSYLAMIGMFLLTSWLFLQDRVLKSQVPNSKELPLLMTFFALIVGQFVYYQNTVLAFSFWFILALAVVAWQKPISERAFSFKNFPELGLVFTTFLILIGLVIVSSYYFGQRFYRADMSYLEARTSSIEEAVKLNPYQTHYWIVLARSYLNELAREQDQSAFQPKISRTIEAARMATSRGPGQVAAFETRAMVYREIRLLAAGAREWAIRSFEQAIALEPTNPVFRMELGKLLVEQDENEKARVQFEKAGELKPDYIDVDAIFQLGLIYFNGKEIDRAISQFERVIALFPNHSNALYSLGVAYQQIGRKEEARTLFEKVLELNPDNQDVVQKLKELEK